MEPMRKMDVKPYGSTLKDKLYYALEGLTNWNDYVTGCFWFVPALATLGGALVLADRLNEKARNYARQRLRETTGEQNPFVGSVGIENVINTYIGGKSK
ncbi:MAG: hypothetical protein AB1668_05780 [Nanoarchaeota archaeon]